MGIKHWITIAWIALGLIGGSAFTAAGHWAYDTFVDDPHLIEITQTQERAACAIRTTLAADLARDAEMRRQKAIAQKVGEDFNRIAAEAERNRKLQVERLEKEIADYESDGDGTDVCRITADDLGRLQSGPPP